MHSTRFTLAGTMALIACVSVDLVALGPLVGSGYSFFGDRSDPFFDACALPLALVLQVMLVVAVNRRGPTRPGLVGFQVAGWVALATYLGICSVPGLMIGLINGVGDAMQAAGLDVAAFHARSQSHPLLKAAMLLIVAAVLIAPPWLVALTGGAVASRLPFRRRSIPGQIGDGP